MKKTVEIRLTAKVDPSVSDDSVFQQIWDALNPDGWNWDIDADLIGSELTEDDEEDDEDE